jgi:uncharacterized protein (DUF362 family)/Pyruvate/2-oxoacid:ferredoxin oxidoreductase delta subunit
MGDYTVSLQRCAGYEPEQVGEALSEVLAPLGGMGAFVRRKDRVLIKLNLLASCMPDEAVTTHPAMARAAVRAVQKEGAIAVVGDSPGGRNTASSYEALLRKTGIREVIDDTGCEYTFFDEETTEVAVRGARTFRKFTVARALADADCIIGLPRFKTHQLTGITGAVKLHYGFIPGVAKAEYHLHAGRDTRTFAQLLLELAATVKPGLTIMDAVVAMEGNGPRHGTPRKLGLLMAGTSLTALDFLACTIAGIEPRTVPTVRQAMEWGCGPASTDEITTFGPPPGEFAVRFRKPEALRLYSLPPAFFRIAQRHLAVRPVIDRERCTRCGTCIRDCPPGAIRRDDNNYPVIDHAACIRCFCCQELCPAGAVGVKTPLVRRLIG